MSYVKTLETVLGNGTRYLVTSFPGVINVVFHLDNSMTLELEHPPTGWKLVSCDPASNLEMSSIL